MFLNCSISQVFQFKAKHTTFSYPFHFCRQNVSKSYRSLKLNQVQQIVYGLLCTGQLHQPRPVRLLRHLQPLWHPARRSLHCLLPTPLPRRDGRRSCNRRSLAPVQRQGRQWNVARQGGHRRGLPHVLREERPRLIVSS